MLVRTPPAQTTSSPSLWLGRSGFKTSNFRRKATARSLPRDPRGRLKTTDFILKATVLSLPKDPGGGGFRKHYNSRISSQSIGAKYFCTDLCSSKISDGRQDTSRANDVSPSLLPGRSGLKTIDFRRKAAVRSLLPDPTGPARNRLKTTDVT